MVTRLTRQALALEMEGLRLGSGHDMITRWFQLLHFYHTRESGRRYFGMTFPFILGALREPIGATLSPEQSRLELHSLLRSMLDETPMNYALGIVRCDHLKQPVVAPWDARYRLQGVAFRSLAQSRDTVFVSAEFLKKGPSIDLLTHSLWKDFGEAVCGGRFSIPTDGRDYRPFTTEDRATIQQSSYHQVEEDI